MDRIWNRAEDKNSANIIVYAKKNDDKAYVNKECTVQYKTSELRNAFKKGCIIVVNDDIDDTMVIPTLFSVSKSTNIGQVTYVGEGSTADSIAVISLKSVSDQTIPEN